MANRFSVQQEFEYASSSARGQDSCLGRPYAPLPSILDTYGRRELRAWDVQDLRAALAYRDSTRALALAQIPAKDD